MEDSIFSNLTYQSAIQQFGIIKDSLITGDYVLLVEAEARYRPYEEGSLTSGISIIVAKVLQADAQKGEVRILRKLQLYPDGTKTPESGEANVLMIHFDTPATQRIEDIKESFKTLKVD